MHGGADFRCSGAGDGETVDGSAEDCVPRQTREQIVDTSVPQVVEELAEASKVFSQDRVQQRFGGQIIEALALSLTENVVEMPVTQTQEKMQQVAHTHVQNVANTIKEEKPEIVKQTVQVPQFLNEAVDMLDAVQRQVSIVQKIQKVIETSQWQFSNKIDEMPVAVQRQTPMVQTVQKTMRIPQQQCIDKVVDDPVVHVPQVQIVGKIDEIPEIQTGVGTQTSESFGAAPVSQAAQVENVEAVEIGALIPAESGPPMFVKAPVLEIPVVGQRQALNIQTEQKTIDVPQIQCLEPLVDVPVVTQQTAEILVVMLKQVPTLQRIQKMVEVPQIQYIDKVVDAPVEMQLTPEMQHVASTLATEWEASTPHVVDSSLRKRKSSGSLQSPRARAGMRTHVQDDDIRHEIFHVNIASADEMEEAASVHALTIIRTPSGLDDVKLGMAHVKEDLTGSEKDAGVLGVSRKESRHADGGCNKKVGALGERKTKRRRRSTKRIWRKHSRTRPKP